EGLETELSKSKMMSKSFESVQKHAINLEIELQQCKENIKNDMSFKVNKSKDFYKEREQYFEIQDLKAQLQDKGIAISELKKLIEKLKGKSMETKFEKSSVIRQTNASKSQRPSILGKPTTFSNSFVRKDFSKSTSVTQTHVSNDFSKPVTTQILPVNKKSILKNTNALNPGMYKIHTDHTQTRTSKLPLDSGKTNKRVTFSTGVISSTSVSRPQLKSNPMGDRVLRNNSRRKKQEVEDHRRNVKLPKNKTFVTAYLEVAFRKSTCFIRDLKGNDLLSGSRGTDLHLITLQDTNTPNPICLVAKATSSQAWIVQRGLQAQVGVVRTDKGTEFLNQTLHAYFAAEGIQHQTSIARTPEQNGVVERRNRTLVKAARTMLTPLKDGENLDKMKEKGDECMFVEYSTQSKEYRVFNKRARVIMESIHVNFDELPQMASDQDSYDPAPEYRTVTTSNELDLLFSLMFDELLNGSSKVVSKSSTVSAADAPNQRQQLTTPLNNHITPAPTCQVQPLAPTVISSKNINQAETYAENDQVADDEFINIFSNPVQDQGETSDTSC
nr:hypothetical protein [Tanacetum cinerariifolium]